RKAQLHRCRAAREQHFPMRHLWMLAWNRDNPDYQRCARKPGALLLLPRYAKVRLALQGKFKEFLPNLDPCIAAVDNEAPWRKSSVIRHTRCGCQNRFDF